HSPEHSLRLPRVVRDDPADPDPALADLYASLPYETDLEPWLRWGRRARGPVLYLGVGAGRLAAPLARRGIEVVGVDIHPGMVRVCRGRMPGSEVIRSRIEDLDLVRRFRLVMAPAGVLAPPSPAERRARLLAAAARLAPDGRLGLELINPHWVRAGGAPGFRVSSWRGGAIELEVDYRLPGGEVVTQVGGEALIEPEAVEGWLAAAGLRLVRLLGAPGADLESSPTFYVLSRSRMKRQRRSQMPST
ncbi:MAG: class I SAM-dependent methyltransferase, partial [Candidatus Dormibacteraceae bacterium]